MVNPLSAAYNLFLGFINILPPPILSFLFFSGALFVIVGIIKIVKS